MKASLHLIISPLALIVSLAISIKTHAESRVIRAGSLLHKAETAMAQSDPYLALQLTDSILEFSSNPVSRLEALQIRINALRSLGEYSKCENTFIQAQELIRNSQSFSSYIDPSTPDGETFANLMLNHAQFETALGRYETALTLLDSCRFRTGSEGAYIREGTNASIAYRQGHAKRALEILDSLISEIPPSPTRAMLLQNRGYILSESGNHEDAIDDLSEVTEYFSGKDRALALSNLALARAQTGNSDAIAEIDDALILLRDLTGERSQDYLTALRKKGEILYILNKPKKSAAVIREYFSKERIRLVETLNRMPPLMRLDYWTMEKPKLSRCLMLEETDPRLMLDIALTRRELSMPRYREFSTERINASTEDLRRLLTKGEAAIAFLLYPDKSGSLTYGAIILSYKGEPVFLTLADATFADTYMVDANTSLAEAIASEDPWHKNLLYTDKALGENLWRQIIEALPTGTHTIHFAPEGIFHLWNIEEMPFEDNENYTFVRHSSLLDINHNSTLDPEDSGKLLVAGGLDYNNIPESDIVVAEPDHLAYSELTRSLGIPEGYGVFGNLSGTSEEAFEIAETLGTNECRNCLSEEDFKNEASDYTLLHLATHGYALDCGIGSGRTLPSDSLAIDVSLLRTGLALSGANIMVLDQTRDDGIISAREICTIPLKNTDMVVMSACQTAKGLITDENASGLIRALKIAGVKTIIASLWEVNDMATRLFMTEFYRNLKAGAPKVEAFKKAKNYLRDYEVEIPVRRFSPSSLSARSFKTRTYRPYTEPWYWAPFILIDP